VSASLEEDLKLNRDACREILHQYAPHQTIEFERLCRGKLFATPYPVIAALMWAYGHILAQDEAIRLSIDLSKRASADNVALDRDLSRLRIAIASIHKMLDAALPAPTPKTPPVGFPTTNGPALDDLMEAAAPIVKACRCAYTDAWRCAVDQRLAGQIACYCPCHIPPWRREHQEPPESPNV
jgi:hypothetical protein